MDKRLIIVGVVILALLYYFYSTIDLAPKEKIADPFILDASNLNAVNLDFGLNETGLHEQFLDLQKKSDQELIQLADAYQAQENTLSSVRGKGLASIYVDLIEITRLMNRIQNNNNSLINIEGCSGLPLHKQIQSDLILLRERILAFDEKYNAFAEANKDYSEEIKLFPLSEEVKRFGENNFNEGLINLLEEECSK